jgi:hypothetical protein
LEMARCPPPTGDRARVPRGSCTATRYVRYVLPVRASKLELALGSRGMAVPSCAARGVEGLVMLPSTRAGREAARVLRHRLLAAETDSADAASVSTLLDGALVASGWLEALRGAEERLRCGGHGEGAESALSSAPWCKVVRLEPTAFVPQALQPELVGLVALAGHRSPLEVMHRCKDRATMTKDRLYLGDAMLRGTSCRGGWFLGVPPNRPPMSGGADQSSEDEVRFLLQIFRSGTQQVT